MTSEQQMTNSSAVPLSKLYRIAALVALVVIVLDQITKLWVRFGPLKACNAAVEQFVQTGTMPYCSEILTLGPLLNFRLHLNTGISFSWFSDFGDMGRWILSAVAVLICVILAYYLKKEPRRWFAFGTGLIIGGAIGNLIDRVYIGAVVDFIDFHIGSFHPFIFNVADAGISIGIACLLIDTFFFQPKNS